MPDVQSISSITPFHAQYFAHELTRRCPSDSVDKLAASLANAQVDLNPHQVEAALFAFQSPLSKGAILADEVGLGKTIEAGLLLSQQWAERKRRLLVIVPANLRKQWSQELADKFFLPSVILEARSFNTSIQKGNLNPFLQEGIVICSYPFAKSKAPYLKQGEWDLVVIDEAHRLRNVYKTGSKTAQAIKEAVAPFRKVLLTATPLQNSLLELYGLVSIVDEFVFGDEKSFRDQFIRSKEEGEFQDLKNRLKPICKRTLRKQVLQYIKYTARHALVEEFYPSDEEQRLYEMVTDYLQRPSLYALPASQRQLMTLVLRKLLASSTFAIAHTLEGLVRKLDAVLKEQDQVETPIEESLEIGEDYEGFNTLKEEWEDEDDDEDKDQKSPRILTPLELDQMREERDLLSEMSSLARKIEKNSKGEVLLSALQKGFDLARKLNGPEKAIIFTESKRTQAYLLQILEGSEFKGKSVLFNGSNTDPLSKEIYQQWLKKHQGSEKITGSPTADKRAALVDYFREEASIMIATEAAAEGINLQFCNLVVNFDMPWNPQRIEQRIGRCHRYGQKFDVVVLNFLNKKNQADERVYELLNEKFKLFDGVFGSSDEVLGSIESGIDFEKRVMGIYQKCRTMEQIEFEFNTLQEEFREEIDLQKHQAHEMLLNHFDQEVVEKVKVGSQETLDRYEQWLMAVTRYVLSEAADFSELKNGFRLLTNPFPEESIPEGDYQMGKKVEEAHLYRIGHPLAQRIIGHAQSVKLEASEVHFDYTGDERKNIAILEPLVNKSGWLRLSRYTLQALETEDHLIFSGVTDEGNVIDSEQCRRLFSLSGVDLPLSGESSTESPDDILKDQEGRAQLILKESLGTKNNELFQVEMDKLDRWSEDQRTGIRNRLKELEEQIKDFKRQSRLASNLPEKLKIEGERKKTEVKRDEAWRDYENAARSIEERKDHLLDETQKRLGQSEVLKEIFKIRWRVE